MIRLIGSARKGITRALVLSVSLWCSAPAFGESTSHERVAGPARLMPPKVVAYYGWRGADQLQDSAKTSIGRLLARPELAKLCGLLKQGAVKKLGAFVEEAGWHDKYGDLFTMAETVWDSPVALALTELSFTEQSVRYQVAFCVEAGASRVQSLLEAMISMAGDVAGQTLEPVQVSGVSFLQVMSPTGPDTTMLLGSVGGVFLLTVGEEVAAEIVARIKSNASVEADHFAVSKSWDSVLPSNAAGKSPRAIESLYVDVGAIAANLLAAQPGAMELALIERLGFSQAPPLVGATAIESDGFRRAVFLPLALPQSPSATPISDRDLALVPHDSLFFTAESWPLAHWYREALALLTEQAPPIADDFKKQLGAFESQAGLRIERDLLDALGTHFVIYDEPSLRSLAIGAFVVAARPADPDKLLESISKLIALNSEGWNERVSGDGTIRFLEASQGVPAPPSCVG